jgi:alpha-L-fucosidase
LFTGFCTQGDNLYAIAQSWPDGTAVISSVSSGKGIAGKVEIVTLLGHVGKLEFTQDEQGLKVKMPAERPCDYAYTLKITGLKMNPPGPPVPAVMADLQ